MAPRPRSALARPIDLRYPSNVVAVVGSAITVLVYRRAGRTWSQALNGAGLAFLAWATARELDPDFPVTANAALPLAALAGLILPGGNAAAGFGPLSAVRLLADTTGDRPAPTDHVALLAQAALSARTGGRVAALLPALAPAIAGPGPSSAAPLLGLLVPPTPTPRPSEWTPVPLVAALLTAPAFVQPEPVLSACDRADRPVRAEDVRRARVAAILTLSAGAITRQTGGLLPLAAAVLSVGVRRLRR